MELALAMLALYALGVGAMYALQRRFLFRPKRSRTDLSASGVAGLRAVQVTASDGLRLAAWHRPAREGQPTLVYLHGVSGNLEHRIPRLRRFAETEWGLLFLEYRGYGGNPGKPTEEGLAADARGALRFLHDRGVRLDETVLYGESLGTGVAVRLAAEQDVAAVVLESPYTSIAAVAQSQFWFAPAYLLTWDRFELLRRIGQVRAPLLIVQGGRDKVIPPRMGLRVFAAANEPKELWSAARAGHSNLMRHGAAEAVVRFVNRHVRVRELA